MWTIFSNLAQKNLDHYNEHPGAHAVITVGAAAIGVAVIVVAAKVVNKTPMIQAGSMKK